MWISVCTDIICCPYSVYPDCEVSSFCGSPFLEGSVVSYQVAKINFIKPYMQIYWV